MTQALPRGALAPHTTSVTMEDRVRAAINLLRYEQSAIDSAIADSAPEPSARTQQTDMACDFLVDRYLSLGVVINLLQSGANESVSAPSLETIGTRKPIELLVTTKVKGSGQFTGLVYIGGLAELRGIDVPSIETVYSYHEKNTAEQVANEIATAIIAFCRFASIPINPRVALS
jgi:hypothetical protein